MIGNLPIGTVVLALLSALVASTIGGAIRRRSDRWQSPWDAARRASWVRFTASLAGIAGVLLGILVSAFIG